MSPFCDYNGMKLEVSSRKTFGKVTKMCKLRDALLNK